MKLLIFSFLTVLAIFNISSAVFPSKEVSNNNINACTFTYFKSANEDININDSNKVVIFNENEEEKFQEKIYTKWIDTYTLDDDNYTVIKLKKDNYNIINIPV